MASWRLDKERLNDPVFIQTQGGAARLTDLDQGAFPKQEHEVMLRNMLRLKSRADDSLGPVMKGLSPLAVEWRYSPGPDT